MLFLQVTVVPLNDGPMIVQFNPGADINTFASLADRSHAVELIEEGLIACTCDAEHHRSD